ncbi:acyl-CoA thioesterase [Psychrobium sp. MM17-31]|uniref:acyl-CoA thioesterase n=1 Tax=Psychrobium sp. MM17-31 TaxID=2917758 RepID=UPI001EF48290|nr:thioesterase family protein [Psychrobium sp. MM17-31]MCG7529800.1 acyl-CoA thioesterase [Psychrobium sp. MM17-31]
MTEIAVRGYHLDGYQHVNNARYLEFLEEARWECMGEEIEVLVKHNAGFVVANININYRAPALLHQHLVVETKLSKIGDNSGVVSQVIRCKETGNVVTDAQSTFVLFDMKKHCVMPIIGELRDCLENCQRRLAQQVPNT